MSPPFYYGYLKSISSPIFYDCYGTISSLFLLFVRGLYPPPSCLFFKGLCPLPTCLFVRGLSPHHCSLVVVLAALSKSFLVVSFVINSDILLTWVLTFCGEFIMLCFNFSVPFILVVIFSVIVGMFFSVILSVVSMCF